MEHQVIGDAVFSQHHEGDVVAELEEVLTAITAHCVHLTASDARLPARHNVLLLVKQHRVLPLFRANLEGMERPP